MKTIVLFSIIVLTAIAAVAQQTVPPGNEPQLFIPLHQPATPKNKGSQAGPVSFKPATGKEIHVSGSSFPASFDPVWASRFQTVLDSVRVATGVKGLSSAVLVPGMGTWLGVSGIAGTGIPMTTDRRFGIASNTKLFIGCTLAKLAQDGLLSLDDHLYQWLPSFSNVDSSITIRQLLSHTSGVFDFWNDHINFFWNLILADTSHFFMPEEVLATIGAPKFQPGHGFRYSNTGYLLAGMVIEAATGEPFTASLHNVIFDTLTMDSTFVGSWESKNGPVAHEWVYSFGEVPESPMTSAYTALSTAGNILSTPREMTGWYSALLGGNLLPGEALSQVLKIEPTSNYGLGIFDLEYNGHKLYDHNGTMVGDISEMIYDQQTKSVFCIMTNSREGFNFGDILLPMVNVLLNECPKKPDDAGITNIITPWENGCSSQVAPEVTLKNFGSQPLGSVSVHYRFDNGPVSDYSWTGSLGTDASADVTLPPIAAVSGLHSFICWTSNPNGNPEGYNYNDTATSRYIMNEMAATGVPFFESFDGEVFPPEGWTMNKSSVYSWGRTPLAKFSGSGSAVKANFQDLVNSNWDLVLPLLNIGDQGSPFLSFTYAYARYPSKYDTLIVYISGDCGSTWDVLFYKGGQDLATSSMTQLPFYPQTTSQWKTAEIPLPGYSGNVLIKFRDLCDNGNNLYLDDVMVGFPTGTTVVHSTGKLLVYPNPASGQVSVSGLPDGSDVVIMDLSGKSLLMKRGCNTTTTFDIREFPQGIYFIRSMNSEGTAFGKFIKE